MRFTAAFLARKALAVSQSEVPLSIDDHQDDRHRPPRTKLRRRIATKVVGGVLIGAWVLMPLMPVAAILLSWLNGLS